jgi:hypothetical protein
MTRMCRDETNRRAVRRGGGATGSTVGQERPTSSSCMRTTEDKIFFLRETDGEAA